MPGLPPELVDKLRRLPNPFARDTVGHPYQEPPCDVAELHATVYEQCCQAVREVVQNQRSVSILLLGEPGSGKTHLLARLRKHLDKSPSLVGAKELVFVGCRLRTTGNMIWRHVRREFAQALTGTWPGGPRCLSGALREAFQYGTGKLDGIGLRDLAVILEQLMANERSRDAIAWLCGDPLPDDVLAKLGVKQVEEEELQEHYAREVVLELARLIAPHPVVFSFDQVEALQAYRGDTSGLFAFGKLVTDLHDELPNACLISCTQAAFIGELHRILRGSMMDRVAEYEGFLYPLSWDEGKKLVLRRLEQLPALAELRPRGSPPLWPLEEAQVRQKLSPQGFLPRELLRHCRDLWNQIVGPPVFPPPAVDPARCLDTQFGSLFEEADIRPERSAEVLLDGLPRLLPAWLQDVQVELEDLPRGISFRFSAPLQPVRAVCVSSRPHLNTFVHDLKRLLQIPAPSLEGVILLRDARLRLGPKAERSRELLEKFRTMGGRFVTIEPAELRALEAFRSLAADAQAGDLTCDYLQVRLEQLQAWLRERKPAMLASIVEKLLEKPEDASGPGWLEEPSWVEPMLETLAREKIVSAQAMAEALGVPVEQVQQYARDHPDLVGWIEDTPGVLFALARRDYDA